MFAKNHHLVVPLVGISLTLFATSPYRSSLPAGLYSVFSQSCCMLVRAGRPAFARPCEGVHRSTSLMRSSLFLQQCLACMVRLIWIVFMMGGRCPYSCCFVRCCLQEQFNIACSILVQLPSSFFSNCLVSVYVVHPYSSIETIAAWKKLRFILSVRSDFHMTDNLLMAVHAFVSRVSMCLGRWDTAGAFARIAMSSV